MRKTARQDGDRPRRPPPSLRLTTLGLAVIALAATLAAPGAAQALSHKQADARAVALLRPTHQPGSVVLFGLPHPLPAGTSVFTSDSPIRRGPFDVPVKQLRRKAWLFWEDLHYGAKFEHPSRMLLLDDRTGRALSKAKLVTWPVIDGSDAPFVTPQGYFGAQYRVAAMNAPLGPNDTGRIRSRPRAGPAHPAQAPAPIAAPAGSLKGDCIVTVGRNADPLTNGDFEGLDALLGRLTAAGTGLQSFDADTPEDRYNPAQAGDGTDLANLVDLIIKTKGCTDVMLYLDGHGNKTGPASVYTGTKWVKKGPPHDHTQDWTGHDAYVFADDVLGIIKAHPSIGFKVKIDACYSGRFLIDLNPAEQRNLLVVETSSNAEETSLFSTPGVIVNGKDVLSHTNNPGNQTIEVADPKRPGKKKKVWNKAHGRSEFTNGNLSALETFFTTPQLIKDAMTAGGSLLARGLEYAAAHSSEQDFAAQQGLTHPKAEVDIHTPPQPPIVPIGPEEFGSNLSKDPDTVRGAAFDFVLWLIQHALGYNPRATAFAASSTGPSAPADGQVTQVQVRGNYVAGSCPSGQPDSTCQQIHFQDLRPQSDGSVKVISTTQAFMLSTTLGTYTFMPTNFFVLKGDYVGLATVGGNFNVLVSATGATTDMFQGHNQDMNGSQFTSNNTQSGEELNIEMTLQPGAQPPPPA